MSTPVSPHPAAHLSHLCGMMARRGCAGFLLDLGTASGRQIKQEEEQSSSSKGLDHVPGLTHAVCMHICVSIPMCTCVQLMISSLIPTRPLTTTITKTPQQSVGALPLYPACPCLAQHRCPAWHDQHKSGQSWMEKESHSPFTAFQEPTESHVLQTSQGCTGRRSGCGRKDRQAEG